MKLPAHSLIKFKLRHRIRLFRFSAIGLIEIRLRPVWWCERARFGVAWPVHRCDSAMIVIPLGLAVLGAEFAWARRWLHRLKEETNNHLDKIREIGNNHLNKIKKRRNNNG
ncbi:MAG: PGPGW domain-containing protein [Methylohalobius sp. ZOD2]|nr:hypothetical protein [Methylothermaceae bacterium]